MNKTIVLLPGDGVGPEIVEQAVRVLHAVGMKYETSFSISTELIGGAAIDATGEPDRKSVV